MTTLSKEAFLISVGFGALPADNIETSEVKHTEANIKGFE